MIEFIDPNSNKLVSSGPTMARKAYLYTELLRITIGGVIIRLLCSN